MQLSQGTVDRVKDLGILPVVESRVILKKSGKDYIGLCPFHNDKKPSLTVSPGNGLYHCFSCRAGGDSIKFIRDLDRVSFVDAVISIATENGIPVELDDESQQAEFNQAQGIKAKLYDLMIVASNWFKKALVRSPEAQAYLTARGVNSDIVDEFGIGFAPDTWDSLIKAAQASGWSLELLAAGGLARQSESGSYYDYFRGRVIIPIRDPQGKIVGFTGRSISDQNQPKYLNSPQSPIFDKGKVLFALDKAAQTIKSSGEAILVEGQLDAIKLHQAGICNAVSSQGTALSHFALKELHRHGAVKLVFCYDSDQAGRKAAATHAATAESLGVFDLRIIDLPDGSDPDSFLSAHGMTAFKSLNQIDAVVWRIERACLEFDLQSPRGAGKAAAAVIKILADLDEIARIPYLEHAARFLSGGNPDQVAQNIAALSSRLLMAPVELHRDSTNSRAEILPELSASRKAELLLAGAIMKSYVDVNDLPAANINIDGRALIKAAIEASVTGDSSAVISATSNAAEASQVLSILSPESLIGGKEISDAMIFLRIQDLKAQLGDLYEQWKNCEQSSESREIEKKIRLIKSQIASLNHSIHASEEEVE